MSPTQSQLLQYFSGLRTSVNTAMNGVDADCQMKYQII